MPRQGAEGARTIAVVPFSNLDPEPGTDHFSNGLNEDLIHAAVQIDGLRVTVWDSVAQLRGQLEAEDICKRLSIRYVLCGSVRRRANRLRITAYLIDTSNGHYIWSDSYDRQHIDVLASQADIEI